MLSSNFYNCGLLVASSEILISQRQLIYNPREGQKTQGGKNGNPIHLALPREGTHKPEITQRTTGDQRPQKRKEKKSPQKDWSRGSARPTPPLPQSGRAGRASPGCWAAQTPTVPRPGRTLYLRSLAHSCARSPGHWEVSRGWSGGALENAPSRAGPLPRDGDTKREREFAGVTSKNQSAKEESANWGRRRG